MNMPMQMEMLMLPWREYSRHTAISFDTMPIKTEIAKQDRNNEVESSG